jgi:hypothetical protein
MALSQGEQRLECSLLLICVARHELVPSGVDISLCGRWKRIDSVGF